MNGYQEQILNYQDLAPFIEEALFDPLPAGLVDPAWLELPEIEAAWLELPEIEPKWLQLPEIEPEWLTMLEQKHLEIEQEQITIEVEQSIEEQAAGELDLDF